MNITISQPYGYTQIGQRNSQQDAIAPQTADASTRCFVVCDGVGGRECGEVASALVAESVCRLVGDKTEEHCGFGLSELEQVLRRAYDCLYANRSVSRGMATTLALMVLTPAGVFIAHIGDSPVFQVRRGEGIVFRTRDHSLVADMVARGEISAVEALHHPQRNVIMRCMTVPDRQYGVSEATVDMIADVREGDVFLMCSDGVNGAVSDGYIGRLLSATDLTLRQKCELLRQQTADSHDNNTAWLVEVAGVERDAGESAANTTCETSIGRYFGEDMSAIGKLRRWLAAIVRRMC